jgi:hypothetical protein
MERDPGHKARRAAYIHSYSHLWFWLRSSILFGADVDIEGDLIRPWRSRSAISLQANRYHFL